MVQGRARDLIIARCGFKSRRPYEDDLDNVLTVRWVPTTQIDRIDRKTWLLGIAQATGAIADCTRRRVGAVLYDPATFHVLELGYNGRASGLPGCLTASACPRGRTGYHDVPAGAPYLTGPAGRCDAIHAEDNALRRAREHGVDVTGAHIAITDEPCEGCRVLLRHYAVAHVIWPAGEGAP